MIIILVAASSYECLSTFAGVTNADSQRELEADHHALSSLRFAVFYLSMKARNNLSQFPSQELDATS